ncbi:hypothetical protein ABL841_09185 [Variovorax paradoxus]|uniref:hypothetical protein n=1 Tax=Variovorax paradoxus TaxID=34073 RepID=UPI00037C4F39|nr:hypothetical protein [Variovorax paradoxus]
MGIEDHPRIKAARDKLLRRKWIAISVVLFSAVAAVIGPGEKLIGLYKAWAKPDIAHAQRIRNEYYARLITTASREEARTLSEQLIELSKMSAKYQNDPSWVNKGSSSIAIGFEPDQVVYALSDTAKNKWIVGLDLEAGQGSTMESQLLLERIRRRFENIVMEFRSEEHPLPKLSSKARPLFKDATIEFYSSVNFEQTYGEPLTKE